MPAQPNWKAAPASLRFASMADSKASGWLMEPVTQTTRAQIAEAGWLRALARPLRAYEWLTLGYLLFLNTLIAVFHGNLPGAAKYFAGHIVLAAAIVALCHAAEKWPSRLLRFWRHWYPFVLFIGFFEELNFLSHLVHQRWFDSALIAFDHAVFGAHPTVWLEQFASPALNDAMAFAYATYYFYTVVLLGWLYARGQLGAFRMTMLATAIAYCMGYVIALLWPMEGPYHTLAGLQQVKQLEGYFFTALMNVVQGVARVHGAAFPSLHVAGAMVAVLAAWRYQRRLFWIFLPLFLAMCVSTVYGRYHYFADIPAGAILGVAGFWLATKLER